MIGAPGPESADEQPALQLIGTDADAGVCQDGYCGIDGVDLAPGAATPADAPDRHGAS